MKIKNDTNYLTSDLKKLFLACVDRRTDDSSIRKYLRVEVQYQGTNGRTYSKATYGGSWMRILIYKDQRDKSDYIRRLAWLFCHELEHTKGKHHNDMRGSYWRHWPSDKFERLKWADKFQLRVKPEKIQVKKDNQLIRYENVLLHVQQASSKVKRWQNILKKWTSKEKYYEKILTAANKLPKK